MTQHTSDASVLEKIDALVHEEQRLYGQNDQRITTKRASERFRSNLTSAGICCSNGVLGASSARTRTTHRSALSPLWNATNSRKHEVKHHSARDRTTPVGILKPAAFAFPHC